MDGEGFLLLSDEDIAQLVKPIGARRKLIAKRDSIKELAHPSEASYVQELIFVILV